MNIVTDSFYYPAAHKNQSEDFALAGPNYTILCDGCSSVDGTDIGARILAYVARQNINILRLDYQEFCKQVITSARLAAEFLGLSSDALFATLHVQLVNKKCYYVLDIGDGITINVYGDTRHIYLHDYNNMPPYLNYYPDATDIKNYTTGIDSINSFQFSDGVLQFWNKDGQVPLDTVLDHLLDFPDYNPGFLRRKMKQFFKYDVNKLGWILKDDFSVTAIIANEDSK